MSYILVSEVIYTSLTSTTTIGLTYCHFCLLFITITPLVCSLFFFFNDTATTEIYTLSLHDALPISDLRLPTSDFRLPTSDFLARYKFVPVCEAGRGARFFSFWAALAAALFGSGDGADLDRKSTRLNSSHDQISYAVFCLKKKKIVI